jgi:hypothetical protein
MCGIGYIKRNDGYSPIRPLLKSYEEQKSRGQQGFGFVAVKNGFVIGYCRAETEEEIKKKLEDYHGADEILFHHRFPTSTGNYEETAHPILVSNKMLKYDYYVVHNGVIVNPTSLKAKHEALGFEYNTEVEVITGYRKVRNGKKKERIEVTKREFNDSETLAIEIALYAEGKKEEIDAYGSMAFIALQVNKRTKQVENVLFARNINPLHSFNAHGMFTLWSQSKIKDSKIVEPFKLYRIGRGKDKSVSSAHISLASSAYTHEQKHYNGSAYSGHNTHSVGYDTSRVIEIPKCPHGNASSITCPKCAEEKVMSYGKEKQLSLPTPSPYHDKKCCMCDEYINQFQTKVWDNTLQEYIHVKCQSKMSCSKETYDELMIAERDALEAQLDELNGKIEETEQMVGLMEDDNSPQMVEEWFKKTQQLDKLEEEREALVEKLGEVEKTISGLIF